jgi:hypothetical protein
MTVRTFKFVTLTLTVVLGFIVLLGQIRAQAPQPAPNRIVPSQGNGRFQIVNGTPELTRNIKLLDTETGETWITCTDTDNASVWCHMERSSAHSISK